MGTGVPTTATYIVLVAVAAPALTQLNIEPIVSHFFVFYYGVLADITPPVALGKPRWCESVTVRTVLALPPSRSPAVNSVLHLAAALRWRNTLPAQRDRTGQ